jgi:V/A-type H+-transporting ATPase subunit F
VDFFFIGESELVTAFRFVGIKGAAAANAESARTHFRRITEGWDEVTGAALPRGQAETCRVLILTEEVSDWLEDLVVSWQLSGAYPLIVEIPGMMGRHPGRKTLVDSIREAIGVRGEGSLMEEVQSTEVLDREILEDARKKAFRILKSADDLVKANSDNWEKKTREAIAELEHHYADRRQEAVVEILARLPLDMRRIWSEKVETFLSSAVEGWFESLSREQALAVLDRELECRLAGCPEFAVAGTIRVWFSGLDQSEAGTLIKKHLPRAALVFQDSPEGDGDGLPVPEKSSAPSSGQEQYPELVLDISSIRLTASIRKAVDFLLLKKRAELVEALLGPESLKGPGGVTTERDSEGAQGD